MEAKQSTADQAIAIMNWDMPWWWSPILLIVQILIFIPFLALMMLITRMLPPSPDWVYYLLMYLILTMLRYTILTPVIRMRCWTSFLSFTDSENRQNLTRWADIQQVRCVGRWLVMIVMREGMEIKSGMDLQDGRRRHPFRRYILLGMSKDALSMLAKLLREHSTARIIGFD